MKWVNPTFVKLVKHRLPDGHVLWVKAGTQIIDRVWQFIKKHIGQTPHGPGSFELEAAVRSAQWSYWNRNRDIWQAAGELVHEELVRRFGS